MDPSPWVFLSGNRSWIERLLALLRFGIWLQPGPRKWYCVGPLELGGWAGFGSTSSSLKMVGRSGPDVDFGGRTKLLCTRQANEDSEVQQEVRAMIYLAGSST